LALPTIQTTKAITPTADSHFFQGHSFNTQDNTAYGKYVYPKEALQEMDLLFSRELERNFPGSRVEYLV